MIKKLHFKTLLLLFAFLAGSMSVWADETYSLTPNATNTNQTASGYLNTLTEFTYNSVSWKMAYWNPSNLQVKTNQNSTAEFRFYNTSAFSGRIKQVVITFKSLTIKTGSDNGFMFLGGTSEVTATTGGTAGTWDTTKKVLTWTPASTDNFTFFAFYQNGKVASGNNFLAESDAIVVTYESTSPLTSIAVTGSYQKTFHQGDTFNHDGAVVTATFENGNTRDVTANATFSTPDMATTGTKTVTVSYTERSVTKTAAYDITVNAPATLTGIVVSGDYETVFEQNSTFNTDGLTVTANYDDGTSKDVTNEATADAPDLATTGTKTVTVTYNGKTATYDIEVVAVKDYVVLPFKWEGGASSELSSVTGVTVNADKTDYAVGNAPYLVKFNGTGKYIDIKTDSQPGQVSLVIKKLGGANTSTLTIQESEDGEIFTDVEELYTVGVKDAVVSLSTTKQFGETSRFVRIYFTKEYNGTTGSNVGVGPISITKTATITLASACTDGEKYYGTYSNAKAFVVPSDLTVSTVKVADGMLEVTDYKAGDIVKAGTGVMVSSTTAGNHTVVLSEAEGTELDGNMLKASSVEMTGDNKFYRLTMHNGETIGFWWGAENGGTFTIAENKAYLAVPKNTNNARRSGFTFGGGNTTGIAEVEGVRQNTVNGVFNLQGQRVERGMKGLVIVNGKKMLNK